MMKALSVRPLGRVRSRRGGGGAALQAGRVRRERDVRRRVDSIRGVVQESCPLAAEGMRSEGERQLVAHARDRGDSMKPSDLSVGDVVYDVAMPAVPGIVTNVGERSAMIVFADGGRAGGPGLVSVLRHWKPRVRVEVPRGALGNRGWNREQAVKAALRRAGVLR